MFQNRGNTLYRDKHPCHLCVFKIAFRNTEKNTSKTNRLSFSFAYFLTYDVFQHALPSYSDISITYTDKSKETIDARGKIMFCKCIDACSGEEKEDKKQTKKMSLGKGRIEYVGSIMQHPVNLKTWEELLWRKRHKAFTLRQQPL